MGSPASSEMGIDRQVDAVSGATYFSQGFFSNLEKGITCYLNAKQ